MSIGEGVERIIACWRRGIGWRLLYAGEVDEAKAMRIYRILEDG